MLKTIRDRDDDGNEIVMQIEVEEPEVNPLYAFDVEVFPNFVSVVFIRLDTSEDTHQFYLHPDSPKSGESYRALYKFIARPISLVGFNSIGYDEFILKALLSKWNRHQIYKLSCDIVDENSNRDLSELRYLKVPWTMLDLQTVLGTWSSLKQIAVNMQWHKIQDLPLPFDKPVSLDQIPTIMKYNVNDVEITAELYRRVIKEVDLRAGISEEYGVDVRSQSRSGTANRLLEKLYADETGEHWRVFKEGRTPRSKVMGADIVAPNISFESDYLIGILEEIEAFDFIAFENETKNNTFSKRAKIIWDADGNPQVYDPGDNAKFKKEIRIGNTIYDLGVGGLHSRDDPGILVSNDEYEIIDADVSSFYPMIMLNNGFAPAHLGEKFLKVFRKMTVDRLEAKKKGLKLRADALKITINSVFGKMNFANYWLYDPQSFYSVTLNGQLYLLMLIERFEAAGIPVVSANTDGVVCRVSKAKKSTYEAISQQWQQDTDFELEFTVYEKFIRKDVNNYVVVKADCDDPDDCHKFKGFFTDGIPLTGGYKYPIVKEAILNYFLYGKFIQDTLAGADNILDFCLAQKVSPNKFHRVFSRNPVTGQEQNLQWTNRYFASKKGDELLKKSIKTGRDVSLLAGQAATIINDVDPNRPIHDYDIDYQFYIKEAEKVIELIEPSVVQLSLI